MNNIADDFLQTAISRLKYYKQLGEKTFDQLEEKDFHYQPNEESNSLAVIIQHLHGNMLSRWTKFLHEDGEKEWRKRDAEFQIKGYSKMELLNLWTEGWNCFLGALQSLQESDLLKTIYIRKEPLTVIDAINRQLAHYPYHIGQILYLGKLIKGKAWLNLSIPKGSSQQYNLEGGVKDPAKLNR
jgi:Protein of unknown function (DUF1572)